MFRFVIFKVIKWQFHYHLFKSGLDDFWKFNSGGFLHLEIHFSCVRCWESFFFRFTHSQSTYSDYHISKITVAALLKWFYNIIFCHCTTMCCCSSLTCGLKCFFFSHVHLTFRVIFFPKLWQRGQMWCDMISALYKCKTKKCCLIIKLCFRVQFNISFRCCKVKPTKSKVKCC